MFQLQSSYQPAWDQPKAIEEIIKSFWSWDRINTLLWATWTGKTFTMANIIQHLQKPTLLISHNKTLAAQLATELKYFFPNNAVHYFVSYFDYYQPESYLPEKWVYIEKEATINEEIEMYRLATMASLLTRDDVIVVASASSLYGLWQKRFFEENCIKLEQWKNYDYNLLKRQLLKIQYKPVQSKIEPWMFDFQWEMVDIYSSTERKLFRLHFNEEKLELIEIKDSQTFQNKWTVNQVTIRPATQFLQDIDDLETILDQINAEMKVRVEDFKKQWKHIEAERIEKKVSYDTRMIKETGFCNWIENYSVYFDRRLPGEPPNTIFDYFPDDFFLIIDESHMTLPQLRAMPSGDKSRKNNLIDFGFRLPSAIDHRPLNFQELSHLIWRPWSNIEKLKEQKLVSQSNRNKNNMAFELLKNRTKHNSKTLFLSATPAEYELDISQQIVEQLIRPTGLLDPITYIYPKSGDYNMLLWSVDKLIKKKPHLTEFLEEDYTEKEDLKEIFNS